MGERFEHLNHARSLAQYVWLHGAFRENDAGDGREPVPGTEGLREVCAALDAGEPGAAERLAALRRAMVGWYEQMRASAVLDVDSDGLGDALLVRGESAALHGAFAYDVRAALACRARAELFETLAAHPRGREWAEPSPTGCWVATVGGVRTRWDVLDPGLEAMLASIDEPPFPWLVRVLAGVKTFVSACITATPVFVVKNFFRDTLAGYVAGRYRQAPFVGTLSGSVEAFRELTGAGSSAMRDYLLQGGFYSGLVEAETDVEPALRGAASVALRRRWSKLAHWLTRPAWLAEAGTRVDQFRRARQAGCGGYAAGRAARMVSSDFANIGASRGWRMYAHTVPFLNAAIQGMDQLWQIVRRRADGTRSVEQVAHLRKVWPAGCSLAGACLLVWVWNVSDPERRRQYESETEHEKASWATLYDVAGDFDLRLPVPFQIGAAFMKLPEVAFDVVGGVESTARGRFVWSMAHSNLWLGWKPAAFAPVIEVRTNVNFFGAEIVPWYMKYWPDAEQFHARSTLLPYQRVGEALDASPLVVQTLWRGYTGHVGNFVAQALHELMWDRSAHGDMPFPRAWALALGVDGLRGPAPRRYTRWGDEFYALQEKARHERFRKTCAAAPEPGKAEGDPVWCAVDRNTRKLGDAASEMRKGIDEARLDPALSRPDKEARIEAVYAALDSMFGEAVATYRRWASGAEEPPGAVAPQSKSGGIQFGRLNGSGKGRFGRANGSGAGRFGQANR